VKHQARTWAQKEFGDAELGDERRTRRLVGMATRALERPAGHVTEVFRTDAERQGAYDFLEDEEVEAASVLAAAARASVRRVAKQPYAFVAIDGTSLSLVDRRAVKDFGAIGAYKDFGRGLKLIHAYVVDQHGIPSGVSSQIWWARPDTYLKKKQFRPLHAKETAHWLEAIDETAECFKQHGQGTRPWFLLDREGDSWPILKRLIDGDELFTVRSCWDRRLKTAPDEPRVYLRETMRQARRRYVSYIDVPAGPGRRARRARLEVSASSVVLDLKNGWGHTRYKRALNVVLVRERGTTPSGEKPIDWQLLTSHSIKTVSDLKLVVFSYAQRWRIEELHKTWKSGACRIEETQLRTKTRVIKWATIMVTVASRIERIKRLSRERPNEPASIDLSEHEIRALIKLKRLHKKRTETIPDSMPTIEQATQWLAELGGYTGKSSGGAPGSITIRRGLDYIASLASVIQAGDL
jgi:Transposase DNA-binding/Transposase Tn5 dimerisation domain